MLADGPRVLQLSAYCRCRVGGGKDCSAVTDRTQDEEEDAGISSIQLLLRCWLDCSEANKEAREEGHMMPFFFCSRTGS